VNTEQPASEAFLEKFPIESWPTLLIVDPVTERVAHKWLGSANVAQLGQLLDDGERSSRGSSGDALEQELTRADQLMGAGKPAEAAQAYATLLSRASPTWPDRVRVEEARVLALQDPRCPPATRAPTSSAPASFAR
jgi:hypothetical protein